MRMLNGYEFSTPRVATGLAAVAMAAITMGALVVLPAKLDSAGADPSRAEATTATRPPIEVAMSPARVEVHEAISDREVHVHPGRATLGAQEFRGKRHKLSRVAERMVGPQD